MDDEMTAALREQIAELEIKKSRIKGSLREFSDDQFVLVSTWIGEAMRDLRNFVIEERRRRSLGDSVVWWS
jgi:hypothetical protein